MLDAAALASVVPTLERRPVHGPWSRAVALRHLEGPPPGAPPGSPPQPLWPGGPAENGARFTPRGGFGSLYLADSPIAALLEVGAIFQTKGERIITTIHEPFVILAVQGVVGDIVDLTDTTVQAKLGTNDQELRGPWRRAQTRHLAGGAPIPPTQLLARVAYESTQVAGFLYPAAEPYEGTNLVVFTDRLSGSGSSYIESYDTRPALRQRLP